MIEQPPLMPLEGKQEVWLDLTTELLKVEESKKVIQKE